MKLSKLVLFAIAFIVIQGIGMAVMYYGMGVAYGTLDEPPIIEHK